MPKVYWVSNIEKCVTLRKPHTKMSVMFDQMTRITNWLESSFRRLLEKSRDQERTSFSLGILIVGSLLWDQTQHRKRWRQNRLDRSVSYRVFVPIRYGRESNSRGGTYTVVFSRALENEHLGCAVVVPCARKITSIHDLVTEAEFLWGAEQRKPNVSSGRVSASWGCVGLLTNPNRKIPAVLLQGWNERVKEEPNKNYEQFDHACDELPAINQNGILTITWPLLIEGGDRVPFDLLLATVTKPTLVDGRYASAQKIAKTWIADSSGNVTYFENNRKYGITTFQDKEICAYLRNHRAQLHITDN